MNEGQNPLPDLINREIVGGQVEITGLASQDQSLSLIVQPLRAIADPRPALLGRLPPGVKHDEDIGIGVLLLPEPAHERMLLWHAVRNDTFPGQPVCQGALP